MLPAVDAGSNVKDTLGQKAAKLDRETEELKRALTPPSQPAHSMQCGFHAFQYARATLLTSWLSRSDWPMVQCFAL